MILEFYMSITANNKNNNSGLVERIKKVIYIYIRYLSQQSIMGIGDMKIMIHNLRLMCE